MSGAFVISWCLWNYQIIIHLFTSYDDPEAKIANIGSYLVEYQRSFWLPLATTLFFIFAYPFLSKWVYAFHRWHKKELRKIHQKHADEEPVSQEEYRNYKKQMTLHVFELEDNNTRITNKMSGLKDVIQQLKNEKNEYLNRLKAKEEEIEDLQYKAKTFKSKTPLTDSVKPRISTNGKNHQYYGFKNEEHYTFLKKIISQLIDINTLDLEKLNIDFMPNKTTAEYIVQRGIDNNLFRREHGFLELTKDGRAFIVENGLTH